MITPSHASDLVVVDAHLLRSQAGVAIIGSLTGHLIVLDTRGLVYAASLGFPVLDACLLRGKANSSELLAISEPSGIQVINLATGTVFAKLPVEEGQPTRIAALYGLGALAFGDEAGGLYCWDYADGTTRRWQRHRKSVHQLLVIESTTGSLLVSGADDRLVHVTDAVSGDTIASCHPHVDWIESLVATRSADGGIHLLVIDRRRAVTWALDSAGRLLGGNAFDVEKVSAVAAWRHPATGYPRFAVGTENADLILWGADLEPTAACFGAVVSTLAASPDGKYLIALRDGRVLLGRDQEQTELVGSGRTPLLAIQPWQEGFLGLDGEGKIHIFNGGRS